MFGNGIIEVADAKRLKALEKENSFFSCLRASGLPNPQDSFLRLRLFQGVLIGASILAGLRVGQGKNPYRGEEPLSNSALSRARMTSSNLSKAEAESGVEAKGPVIKSLPPQQSPAAPAEFAPAQSR